MLQLLLTNKDVQKLWLAQMLSFIGDWAALIALAGLLLDRTGSVAWTTVPTIASAIGLLIGLLIAWVGDAYSKRAVIVIADIVRAIIYGLLGFMDVPLPLLVALLIFAGVATTIFNGARGAIWQEVVTHDKLQAVRSLSMATFAATTAIGSAIGAGLWQTIGAKKALLCNALTFIISGLLVVRLKNNSQDYKAPRINALALVKTVWSIPQLRTIVLFSTFGSLAAETAERLVVPYAHTYVSNGFASILATTAAIGSLLGTVLITKYLVKRFPTAINKATVEQRLRFGVFIQSLFYILILLSLALPANSWTSVAVFAFIGLFFSFGAVVQPAAISLMPKGRQAGIFTLIEATNYGALLIGSAVAGLCLQIFSPRQTLSWMILITLVIFTIYTLRFRKKQLTTNLS